MQKFTKEDLKDILYEKSIDSSVKMKFIEEFFQEKEEKSDKTFNNRRWIIFLFIFSLVIFIVGLFCLGMNKDYKYPVIIIVVTVSFMGMVVNYEKLFKGQ